MPHCLIVSLQFDCATLCLVTLCLRGLLDLCDSVRSHACSRCCVQVVQCFYRRYNCRVRFRSMITQRIAEVRAQQSKPAVQTKNNDTPLSRPATVTPVSTRLLWSCLCCMPSCLCCCALTACVAVPVPVNYATVSAAATIDAVLDAAAAIVAVCDVLAACASAISVGGDRYDSHHYISLLTAAGIRCLSWNRSTSPSQGPQLSHHKSHRQKRRSLSLSLSLCSLQRTNWLMPSRR